MPRKMCWFWFINVWKSLLGVRRERFWPTHNHLHWKCPSKCYNGLRMMRGVYTSRTSQSWDQIRRPSVTIFSSGDWSAIFNRKTVAVVISKEDYCYGNLRIFGFIEQIIWRLELYHGNCCVFLLLDWPRPMLKKLRFNEPTHNSFSTNDCEA